jgi:hypothetical protein
VVKMPSVYWAMSIFVKPVCIRYPGVAGIETYFFLPQ